MRWSLGEGDVGDDDATTAPASVSLRLRLTQIGRGLQQQLHLELLDSRDELRTMGRPSQCSRKYGMPLFTGAWVTPLKALETAGDGDGEEGVVVLAGGGGNQRNGVPNRVLLAEYDFLSTTLTEALDSFDTGDDPPFRLAAHRDGVVCSFEKDCRIFQVRREEGGEVKLEASEREVTALQGVGEQNCLVFSPDGTRFAAGGDDGHLRVFEWGTLKVLLDKPEAHKSIKDLDFSLDGTLVASTSDDSACRIWDVASGSCVSSLPLVKGEEIGFVRFSRDGSKPLLYGSVRKQGRGFVSAFDTSTWKLVKSRKLQDDPISAFSIARDGRFLAVGSSDGDVSIVNAANLSACQKVKGAHMIFVTSLEFSPNGRALLSVSADSSALVTTVTPVSGVLVQGVAIFLLIIILAMLLLHWSSS